MKTISTLTFAWLATLLFTGCVANTIEKRRAQRISAYQGLPPDHQTAVDSGQIKVGMSKDAVYIALGKPQEILRSESSAGNTETWLYHGAYLEGYWNYHYPYSHYAHHRDHCWYSPQMAYQYYPRRYVAAEIVFEDEQVKQWRHLPQPQH